MSDWASSNLEKKKIPRLLGASSSFKPTDASALLLGTEAELDSDSEGEVKVAEIVRDPFAELDLKISVEENQHHDMLGTHGAGEIGGKAERLKQTNASELTMFSQAFKQVRKLDLSLLRAAKVKGTTAVSFDVVFRGEDVAGEGGPYRQFFADISAELQPSGSSQVEETLEKKEAALSLLIPTPNNKAKMQDSKDKFIVNPNEPNQEIFEFLGVLMGCCIRTGVHLTLNLPTLFWKLLSGEKILITDFEEVDDGLVRQLRAVLSADSQEYIDAFYQNYSVKSVDGVTDIPLL